MSQNKITLEAVGEVRSVRVVDRRSGRCADPTVAFDGDRFVLDDLPGLPAERAAQLLVASGQARELPDAGSLAARVGLVR